MKENKVFFPHLLVRTQHLLLKLSNKKYNFSPSYHSSAKLWRYYEGIMKVFLPSAMSEGCFWCAADLLIRKERQENNFKEFLDIFRYLKKNAPSQTVFLLGVIIRAWGPRSCSRQPCWWGERVQGGRGDNCVSTVWGAGVSDRFFVSMTMGPCLRINI